MKKITKFKIIWLIALLVVMTFLMLFASFQHYFLLLKEIETKEIITKITFLKVEVKQNSEQGRKVEAVVTAYSVIESCHFRDKEGRCLMASGKPVYRGAIACPNFLRLGQKVRIEGKIYTCEDKMSKRYRYSRNPAYFDIFMWSYDQAILWGRQKKVVEILN